jgi:hypothetical protein
LWLALQTHKAALDLFIDRHEVVSSLVLVPFPSTAASASCYRAGLYVTHSSTTNFAAAKPAIISIATMLKHVVPPLLLNNNVVASFVAGASKVCPSLLQLKLWNNILHSCMVASFSWLPLSTHALLNPWVGMCCMSLDLNDSVLLLVNCVVLDLACIILLFVCLCA